MSLFIDQSFTSHSGKHLPFKIECDNLTDEDLDVFCEMIINAGKTYPSMKFREVCGIPSGGLRIADKLKYKIDMTSNRLLIIDDVLTTGKSMEEMKINAMQQGWKEDNIFGIVLFSRADYAPLWITPIYELNWRFI
jgi:pyrimidine operon attenuation protein/uracil phosphoribosyltransferase